jgi:hypothetical protein
MFSILTKQYRIETEEEYIKWMIMAKYRPKKQKNVGKLFEAVINGNNLQYLLIVVTVAYHSGSY